MKPAIVAEKLTIIRGKNEVLHGISCEVKRGTVTGLIGPSGSGKTTLMRAIVSVQKINDGTLTVLDEPAGSARLRSRIGYVTQSPAVYDDITVEQNLDYFASIIRAGASDVTQALKAVYLEPQRKQLVGSLSGGQYARVSLAVALLGKPELLVFDEPTVGLDPILRDELWSLFAELARDGQTLLVSSHVMDEAERCSELILMRDGTVIWNDTKDVLLKATKTRSVGDAFVRKIRGNV